ncbi:hypothetical protein ACFV4N_23875 [Actinosynnema sp. NPDC059797]
MDIQRVKDHLVNIADRLGLDTESGDSFRGDCPGCHGARQPLYLRPHNDMTTLVFRCGSCGREGPESLLADVGLTWADLDVPPDTLPPCRSAAEYAERRFDLTADDLAALGVKDEGGRMWVPLRDHNGQEIGRQGRDYTGDSAVKWLSTRDRDAWPMGFLGTVRLDRPVVVTEGPGDGLTAWRLGFNAFVVLGAGPAANDPRVTVLARAAGLPIITAFDADEPGHRATVARDEWPAVQWPDHWGKSKGRKDLTDFAATYGDPATHDLITAARRPRPRLKATGQRAILDLANLAVERHLDLGLFRQGATIMSLVRTTEGGTRSAELKPVTPVRLAALVAEQVDVYREVPRKGDDGQEAWDEQAMETVGDSVAARALQTDAILGIPAVRALVSRPVLLPDGSILSTEGYHADQEVIYAPARPQGTMPTVDEARDYIRQLTRDFPFRSEDDRGRFVGALIMPAVRAYVAGGLGRGLAMPGVVITASTPGTGKSYLATLLQAPYCPVSSGRDAAAGKTGDEVRKWISTKLLGSDAVIAVDNVRTGAKFGGPEIDALLTASTWQDRTLGSNQEVRALNDRLWVWSGNNIAPEGDTADRVIHVRLDLDTGNPAARDTSTFAVGDLEAHLTQENRDRLLMSILALAKGWHDDGAPVGEGNWRSYSRLVQTVDGILSWADLGRFKATDGRVDTGEDDGDADWEAFFTALYESGRGWSSTELAEVAGRPGDPVGQAAAHVIRPANGSQVTRAYAATVLRGRLDAVIGRLKLVQWPDAQRRPRNWAVIDTATRQPGGPAVSSTDDMPL